MNTSEEFKALIEQLAYLDHEHGTDVAGEITEVIGHARAEGLSAAEIVELAEDRVKLLRLQSVLADDEMIRVVEAIIQHLPDALSLI